MTFDPTLKQSAPSTSSNTSTPIKPNEQSLNLAAHTLNLCQNFIPISKWNLKFTDESETMGLNKFLERVDELSITRGVDKSYLFDLAVELLGGKALNWFRSVCKSVQDGHSLCIKMREEFLPNHYSEKLWNTIKKRTQGDNKSVGMYLAVMNNLFDRMDNRISEQQRLTVIRRNLLPFY